jgi:membrane-bound ClpP family serine protease
MLVPLMLYFGVGLGVLLFVGARSREPREKEVGDWMVLMATSPYTFWLVSFLWPLWLLMLCLPLSIPDQDPQPPSAAEVPIGSVGTVVVPLMPVGRVVIDGMYRDARAEFGIIPTNASIVVIRHSVEAELVVKQANKAPEPTPGSVTPRATEGASK